MPRTPGTLGHLADHERWDQFITDVEAGLIGVGPKGDKGDKGDPGDLSAAGMAAAANAVSAAATAEAAEVASILAQDAAEDARDTAVTAAIEALASQTAAQNSATAADVDATAAANSALLAEKWATLTGQPVTGSEYSAKHHAQEAAAWGSTRGAKIAYQPTEPTDPVLGEMWIDSNADTFDLNEEDILPPQSGQSGKYLSTNGTAPFWTAVDLLPGVSGQAGKFLSNNGSVVSWETVAVDALPSQTGQSGKFLTTDGTTASWAATASGVTVAVAPFAWAGTVAVGSGLSMRWYAPWNGTILGVQASLRTASTSGSVIVDVNKNGSTIFTTQANRPTMAASSNYSGFVTSADITSITAGDYFTVDIDSAGTNAADLLVVINYSPTGV